MAEFLYGKEARLVVGNRDVSAFRFSFAIKKTLSRAPNVAEIQIYNLPDTVRGELEQENRETVVLNAGYEGQSQKIFKGKIRDVSFRRENADILTVLQVGDGEARYRRARINRSFGAGTPIGNIVESVAGSLGVGEGNLRQFTSALSFEEGAGFVRSSLTVSGRASDELDGLLSSAGVEWSIQDENLQLLRRGEALNRVAFKVGPNSGLKGEPERSKKRVVTFDALLIPDLLPGRKIDLQGEFVRGTFKIVKTEFNGDTHGDDWTARCECRSV